MPVSVGQQQQCGEPEEALPGRGGQAWPARRHGGHGRPGDQEDEERQQESVKDLIPWRPVCPQALLLG